MEIFTRVLEPQLDGILNRCCPPTNKGVLEACNNKNKVLKGDRYRFRENAYVLIKNRAASWEFPFDLFSAQAILLTVLASDETNNPQSAL